MAYDVKRDIEIKFPLVWDSLTEDRKLNSHDLPTVTLLGGQPGAGKSQGTLRLIEEFNEDLLIINGDEFRVYHRDYQPLFEQYGQDAAKHTAEFAGKMVGKVRDEAVKKRLNVVIEGTFRTVETPLNELQRFKQQGYLTRVVICTCPQHTSWESTLKRAEALRLSGGQPRYVAKPHHDLVVQHLAENVKWVFETGNVDRLEIYSRTQKLFDSTQQPTHLIPAIINNELYRE